MAKKSTEKSEIEIRPINVAKFRCNIVGVTPLIMHRFSKKARESLLFPAPKANAAEKAENIKHDPLNEFRESVYLNRNQDEPTRIHTPTAMFSKALANAALDMPGASKSQMLRLTSVTSTQINIYGEPQMMMSMVRSSDMAKTPDVRTRSVFPNWACSLEIEYVASLIKEGQIANLLGAAGVIVGVGDWRPQKGGSFGKFMLCGDDDPEFRRIVKSGGRDVQVAALSDPGYYDEETEELYTWFVAEAAKREKVVPSSGDVGDMPAALAKSKRSKTRANGATAN